MNAKMLGLAACLVVLLASRAFASQPATAQRVVTLSQAIHSLEVAVADLRQEFVTPVAGVPIDPQPQQALAVAPAVKVDKASPISFQYRVITATVQFNRLHVAYDDGPELWYTQGSFVDPTDSKTYSFLFNDMAAMASSRDATMDCVVVFRPVDRELTEDDVATIIPVAWLAKDPTILQTIIAGK